MSFLFIPSGGRLSSYPLVTLPVSSRPSFSSLCISISLRLLSDVFLPTRQTLFARSLVRSFTLSISEPLRTPKNILSDFATPARVLYYRIKWLPLVSYLLISSAARLFTSLRGECRMSHLESVRAYLRLDAFNTRRR